MFKIYPCLVLAAAVSMTACTVIPEDTSPYAYNQAPVYTQPANGSYQSASSYSATPAAFQTLSCPVGTTPHSSGTCLLDDQTAELQSTSFASGPSARPEPVQTAPRASNVISASTTPTAPSAYMGTEITRSYGDANHRVVSGDTVYSLARRLCVPVSTIQGANGLDANYGIQIGQSLKLPASQC